MTLSSALLKAEHLGIRELREHLSSSLKKSAPIIVTDHGSPKKVLISYNDIMEIVDIMDELQDVELMELVRKGRAALKRGAKGIPVSKLFGKVRAHLNPKKK